MGMPTPWAVVGKGIKTVWNKLPGINRKKKPGEVPLVVAPPPSAADAVAATNPPNAVLTESENVKAATGAAARTRRRAQAGHAGRVTPRGRSPVASLGYGGTRFGPNSAPRSLLGS